MARGARKVLCACAWVWLAGAAGCALPPARFPSLTWWKSPGATSAPDQFAAPDRKLKDEAQLHLKWAQLQEHNGRPQEARKSYETVLREKPKSVQAILGLARLDQLAGRLSEAEAGYQKALALEPRNPHVLNSAGHFYASQRRWDRAIELLRAAMLAAPDEPKYEHDLAVALARSGKYADALAHFTRTVGQPQAHYNLGYILYEAGRLEEAEAHFVHAATLKPDLQQARMMLGRIRQEREARLMLTGGQTSQTFGHAATPTHTLPAPTPQRQTSPPTLPPSSWPPPR